MKKLHKCGSQVDYESRLKLLACEKLLQGSSPSDQLLTHFSLSLSEVVQGGSPSVYPGGKAVLRALHEGDENGEDG